MSRGNDLKAWQNGGHSENTQNAAHTRHTWSLLNKSTTAHLSYLSPRNGGRAGGRGNGAKDGLAHASDDLRCGVRQWSAARCCMFAKKTRKNPVRKMCFMWGLHMKEQKRVHPRSILTWERTCDLIYPFCGPRCYVESNLNPHSHWTLRVCHHVPTPTRETNRLYLDIYMGAQMELCSTIVNCSCSTRLHMIFWSYWFILNFVDRKQGSTMFNFCSSTWFISLKPETSPDHHIPRGRPASSTLCWWHLRPWPPWLPWPPWPGTTHDFYC